ncbi:diguanylate cyclase, partial [Francisella tularensis]|nr:diguanylate cyclase [Francisella tularensis]
EKSKLILDTQIISDKFIINYLTPDITKYLNLNLEIFAIDGLVAAINISFILVIISNIFFK